MGTRSDVGNELFSEAKEDITDFLKTRTCSMFVTRSGGGLGPAAAPVVNCARVFGIFCPVWNISQSQQPRGNIMRITRIFTNGFLSFHRLHWALVSFRHKDDFYDYMHSLFMAW